MTYFVYILQSEKDYRFYYGKTHNLTKRLDYHNAGKSTYTKKFTPWKIFAYKTIDRRSEAMKYEKMLKNLHSKEKVLAFIRRHDFMLPEK